MLASKKAGMPSRLIASLLTAALALPAAAPVAYAQSSSQQQQAKLSQAQLEALVAPIALYPDPLVSQVLMASTYPLEVGEASNWAKSNSNLKGDALNQALQQQSWDASVKSLVSFPPVLEMMGSQLSWTQQLGNAVLAQQSETMSAIQALRAKAKQAGSLQSNSQQTVTTQGSGSSQTIIIEPANPQVVYVPTYNPTVVYGAWAYPAYPPYAYYPPGYVAGTALLSFGVGMAVGAALWGGCHWGGGWGGGGNSLTINNNNFNNFNRNTNNNWSGNRSGNDSWKPDQQRRNANLGGGAGGANRNAERDQLRQNLKSGDLSGNRTGDRAGNIGSGDRAGNRSGADRAGNRAGGDRSGNFSGGDRAASRPSGGGDRFGGGGGFGDTRGARFDGGGFFPPPCGIKNVGRPHQGDGQNDVARIVKNRGCKGVDARCGVADRAGQAVAPHFVEFEFELSRFERAGNVRPQPFEIFLHGFLNQLLRQIGGKDPSRGGARQRHHCAGAQVDVQGVDRVDQAHDGGAMVAPDGQRHAVSGLLGQRQCKWCCFAHRVQILKTHQTQLNGRRAQPVVACGAVLLDQSDLAKAHQIRVRTPRRHGGGPCQIAQGHGTTVCSQGLQQGAPYFDGLYASAFFFVFFSHVHPRFFETT